MSTGKLNITSRDSGRLAALLQFDQQVFHAADLARIWGIMNENTLHTTLKRYRHKGLIKRIYRGFYALKAPEELNPWYLGLKALHGYGYVSTESVLARAGLVNQPIDKITLVAGAPRRFSIGGRDYLTRQLKDAFLYNDYGISQDAAGIRAAGPVRAVADLLYFNPRAYFDGPVDWPKVKAAQKVIGYPLTPQRYL